MRHSIATVSLSGTLQEKLEAIAAAHFDGVEIFENDLLFSEETPRDVSRRAADLGLKIVLFQPFRDFEGVPAPMFQRNLDRAERKFDLMGELGAPMMLVCSSVSPAAVNDDALAAAQLHALAERAAARGIRLAYEGLAWGAHVRTYGDVLRIVRKVNHPHFGVALDSFHSLALGDDPAGIAQIDDGKIFFLQLADAPKLQMDVLTWSRHFRCFPGQGEFDVAGFTLKALEAGYAGPLSLEIFNDEFRGSSARRTAADGKRSLLFLEEQIRELRQTEPESSAKARARRADLIDPPPAPGLFGVAFIEFAVEGAAEHELAAWLIDMGFRKAGRHRSKDVTLYRQGEAAVVLNADRDSFAQSYFLLHGPAVCAVGLRVDDIQSALTRAELFGCARYEGAIGPADEEPMIAVRAPDGSLVYLVKQTFEFSDFEDDGAAAPQGGPMRVDHIAQAVPADQFDSWLLYYRAVFGLNPEASWVLPDPYGLVRSRALASANRAVRFPLSFSDSSRTAVARSLSTFAGAGVQHIAFEVDDIFSAVDQMRRRGVALLPIPENYYDDLTARFGLEDDLLERLRGGDILYDRSAGGAEFFHVYTQFFQKRFFFEVVQRKGGYDQYGAANAPVRMAAQAVNQREGAELAWL